MEIQDSSPLGRLMHDFHCMKAEDMYYEVLRKRVRYFKESKGGKRKMCKIMDDLVKEIIEEERDEIETKARLEGKMEGKREGKIEGKIEGKRKGEILGEIKVIRNYAAANDMTFLEAMIQLHISQHDQQLIMRYL